MKQTRSQFESTYLSENLSDLFWKRWLWLVHDDIILKYKRGADDNIVRDVEMISLSFIQYDEFAAAKKGIAAATFTTSF